MAAEERPTPPPARGLHWSSDQSSPRAALPVPVELIELIAGRAAEMVTAGVAAGPEPWIGVDEAAEHIACNRSRIYALVSAGRIPHEHDGTRLLFRRSALDRWIEAGGGVRP